MIDNNPHPPQGPSNETKRNDSVQDDVQMMISNLQFNLHLNMYT